MATNSQATQVATIHMPQKADYLYKCRLYILPSRQGVFFCISTLLILLGAINYSSSMAYILCFLLFGTAMSALFHSYFNVFYLRAAVMPVAPVFAGDTLYIPIHFFFPSEVSARSGYSLHVKAFIKETYWFRWRNRDTLLGETDFAVSGGSGVTVSVPAGSRSRGRHSLQSIALRVQSKFPLGIFHVWFEIPSAVLLAIPAIVIWPRPNGEPTLRWQDTSGEGLVAGNSVGVEDFSGLRKYRPGDPVRAIVWRTLAQQQELMVKEFAGRGSKQLLFSWEQTRHCGDVETRLSQLCLWLLRAEESGFLFALQMPNANIPLGSGNAHLRHCLTVLANFGQ